MNKVFLLSIIFLFGPSIAFPEVITVLPTHQKVIALTFDACETKTPSFFDKSILGFLVKEKIPCTFFISAAFAERNRRELSWLTKYEFIEIENHSVNHVQHMDRLSDDQVMHEIDDKVLYEITGKKQKFFRFPAGNYDARTLKLVEKKYKVVHWTFPSGDPDKNISPKKLEEWVLSKTKPGSILIFHINGRGYSTGKALPKIVKDLKSRGYNFVKLEDIL